MCKPALQKNTHIMKKQLFKCIFFLLILVDSYSLPLFDKFKARLKFYFPLLQLTQKGFLDIKITFNQKQGKIIYVK